MSCGKIASSGCSKILPSARPNSHMPKPPKIVKSNPKKPTSESENIKILRRAEIQINQVEGSETAKSAIHPDIKLKIYNSSAKVVEEISGGTNEGLSRKYIQQQYRQKFIKIFDDVIDDICEKKIMSDKQLDEEIVKAINKKIGNNESYSFIDEELTYKMNFSRVSIVIFSSINMVKLIKNSVTIGGGGYIFIKEKSYEQEDALI